MALSAQEYGQLIRKYKDSEKEFEDFLANVQTNEENAVRKLFQMCKALATLKEETEHGEWMKTLSDLGLDRKRAERMLNIANAEWLQNGPPGTHLLQHLPTCVQKLADLAKLNTDQLEVLAPRLKPKKATRPRVTREVLDILGKRSTPTTPKKRSISSIQFETMWDKTIETQLKLIADLDPATPPGVRRELCMKMKHDLDDVTKVVEPNLEDQDPMEYTGDDPEHDAVMDTLMAVPPAPEPTPETAVGEQVVSA